MQPYDLIVVGTGTGDLARRLVAKGRLARCLIDEEPYVEPAPCAGCDPKKVLVGVSELIDWHRRMTGRGRGGDARLDWPALMSSNDFHRACAEQRGGVIKQPNCDLPMGWSLSLLLNRFSPTVAWSPGSSVLERCSPLPPDSRREHVKTRPDFSISTLYQTASL